MHPPVLAIVVPCFNEEAVLPTTIPVLRSKLDALREANAIANDSYILLVDDGSTDATWSVIGEAGGGGDRRLRGLRLATNVGHQSALLAGLHAVTDRCDAAVSIDADLQDDVDAIDAMVEAYRNGTHVVLGIRDSRTSDTFAKRTTAAMYYRLLMAMGVDVAADHADFRLLSRQALCNLSAFRERNLFLRAFPKMLHREVGVVTYSRLPRTAGESKYTVAKMLRLAWDGISSFSVVPLRVLTMIGLFISISSIFTSLYVVWGYISGDTVPGWASITLPLYLLGGLIMLSIGTLGEYIAKIFIEVKARPRFFIDETYNMDGAPRDRT